MSFGGFSLLVQRKTEAEWQAEVEEDGQEQKAESEGEGAGRGCGGTWRVERTVELACERYLGREREVGRGGGRGGVTTVPDQGAAVVVQQEVLSRLIVTGWW